MIKKCNYIIKHSYVNTRTRVWEGCGKGVGRVWEGCGKGVWWMGYTVICIKSFVQTPIHIVSISFGCSSGSYPYFS